MTTPDPSTARVAEALRKRAKVLQASPSMPERWLGAEFKRLASELEASGTEKGE